MSIILLAVGCIVVTGLVVVVWSALVVGAWRDEQAEQVIAYQEALRKIAGDQGE